MNPSKQPAADAPPSQGQADSVTAAADTPPPQGQADGATAAADAPPAGKRYDAAPAVLAAVLVLCTLAFALWYAQIRADNREAERLCETVSLLVRDRLTDGADPGAVSTAGFAEAGNLDGIALPDALRQEAGRRVNITVNNTVTPYLVTVQVQGADGTVAAESRFTAWPLADQAP